MGSFANKIKKVTGDIGKNMHTVRSKIAFDLSYEVASGTPVMLGAAKGNWLPSIGSPITSETSDIDTSKKGSLSGESVRKLQAVTEQIAGDDTFYLTNNLPYIRRLEYGHSDQQPTGWVRLSIQRFQAIAKRAADQVK